MIISYIINLIIVPPKEWERRQGGAYQNFARSVYDHRTVPYDKQKPRRLRPGFFAQAEVGLGGRLSRRLASSACHLAACLASSARHRASCLASSARCLFGSTRYLRSSLASSARHLASC